MSANPLNNRATRSRWICGIFTFALALTLTPAHQTLRAAAPVAPPISASVELANNAAALQSRLKATPEEWSILYPRLQRIAALREEVHATVVPGAPVRNTKPMGIFDSPLGGTSLDAPPAMASGGNRGGPFDPNNAPGSPAAMRGRGVLGLIGVALGRAMIDMAMPAQGNTVQNLLTELQSLVNATETSDEEIREKLAAVRAARTRAARDLDAAQNDLTPFLTPDQLATLVALGYLD